MSLQEEVARLRREVSHFGNVMATPREVISKAFQDIQTTLLEQEMQTRGMLSKVMDSVEAIAAKMASMKARSSFKTTERASCRR